jgi:hypothetical protein
VSHFDSGRRLRNLPSWASMTRILLRMWLKEESATQPFGGEAMHLVVVDSARVRIHRIPSFTD